MQDEIGSGLNDDDLINYLRNNYKTNSVLSYDSARDILYGEIEAPQNNGQVYGVYTNYSVTLPSGVEFPCVSTKSNSGNGGNKFCISTKS